MRLKSGILMLVCLALLLPGCQSIEDLIGSHDQPPATLPACETVGPALIGDLSVVRLGSHPFKLSETVVDGDVLCATVEYGGGCADHEFNLHVHSEIMAGRPPQVNAVLTHNSNNDPCKALITRKVGFDLTPLKEHLRRITGQQSGTVALHISGYNQGQTVLYSY